jgi:NADPH:quinone reductase-like Zn-dependent oxidoreductase
VGKLAIQLAKLTGIGRIITIASAVNSAELQTLELHMLSIVIRPERIAKKVKTIVGPGDVCPGDILSLFIFSQSPDRVLS